MLIIKLMKADFTVKQAAEDADTLIVNTVFFNKPLRPITN